MNTIPTIVTNFELGQIVATPGAFALGVELGDYLQRHASCDWGDMTPMDKMENDLAYECGFLRILSAYDTHNGKLWIITEADHSATTLLLPGEY